MMLLGMARCAPRSSGVGYGQPDEIRQMQRMVEQGHGRRALGISTGYFPAFVTTDEIIEVTKPGSARRPHASHIRNEGDGLLGVAEEIIEIMPARAFRPDLPHQDLRPRNWWKVDALSARWNAR